jgi:hypothetical protein
MPEEDYKIKLVSKFLNLKMKCKDFTFNINNNLEIKVSFSDRFCMSTNDNKENDFTFVWWAYEKIKKWIDEGKPELKNGEISVEEIERKWSEASKNKLELETCKKLLNNEEISYSFKRRIGFQL